MGNGGSSRGSALSVALSAVVELGTNSTMNRAYGTGGRNSGLISVVDRILG